MELDTLRERAVDKHKSIPNVSIMEASERVITPTTDLRGGIEILQEMLADHENDLNFPDILLLRMQNALARAEELEEDKESDGLIQEELQSEIDDLKACVWGDSPYAPVRAVCPPTDDPSMPTLTARVWIIGLSFIVIFEGINNFFKMRLPAMGVDHDVAQLLAYPCGRFLAKVLPKHKFKILRWHFTLNAGPFNQKEHMLISIFVANGLNGNYFTDIIPAQVLPIFYNDPKGKNWGYQMLGSLSIQMLGYGTAGISRRFIVYPMQQVWPSLLSTVALNKALHHEDFMKDSTIRGPFGTWWKMSRARAFYIFASIAFLWYWIPDVFFQALGTLNWLTWISPSNVKLALITGHQGLGFNPLPTLDYQAATVIMQPLTTPLFSILNWFAGCVIWGVFAITPLYFTNTWNAAYLPILSNKPWDKFGKRYNISQVMDTGTLNFNQTKYDLYSPMYLSTANALRDMSFLMSNSALITYAALYFHKEIISGFKAAFNFKTGRGKDIHNQLMAAYPEVPEWWYLIILISSVVAGCVMVEVYDTGMPIWGVFFAAGLATIMVVPTGIILGATNVTVYFNVLGEYVAGYAIPGKPLANMLFKAFSVIAPSQSLMFSSGLKLGHYSKIPPRDMFWVQTIGAVLGTVISILVTDWNVANIPDLCTDDQKAHFSCPAIHTFFTGSLTWGLIGPARMYGSTGPYSKLQWLVLAGFLMPIPVWFLHKRYPRNEFFKYIHVPVILSGFSSWVPYGMAYMLPAFYLAMIFNFWIKRKYTTWWQRYNYLLAASFSIGLAISGLVIYFSLQFHDVTDKFTWWGNTVPSAGLDFNSAKLLPMPPSGEF